MMLDQDLDNNCQTPTAIAAMHQNLII